MKAFERIFLYTVLAILVFYVFLVDGNVESQVVIQEEIRARSIVIVNDEGQEVLILSADKRTGGSGRIDICNKGGDSVVTAMGTAKDDGGIMIYNKAGAPVVIMRVSKDDGIIHICNRDSKVIGNLP